MKVLATFNYTNGKCLPEAQFETVFLTKYNQGGKDVEIAKATPHYSSSTIWKIYGFIEFSGYTEDMLEDANQAIKIFCENIYDRITYMELVKVPDDLITKNIYKFLEERLEDDVFT